MIGGVALQYRGEAQSAVDGNCVATMRLSEWRELVVQGFDPQLHELGVAGARRGVTTRLLLSPFKSQALRVDLGTSRLRPPQRARP